jgi:hypothetical protein
MYNVATDRHNQLLTSLIRICATLLIQIRDQYNFVIVILQVLIAVRTGMKGTDTY